MPIEYKDELGCVGRRVGRRGRRGEGKGGEEWEHRSGVGIRAGRRSMNHGMRGREEG